MKLVLGRTQHTVGYTGELGNLESKTPIGRAFLNLVKKDHMIFMFCRVKVHVGHRRVLFG